MKTFAACVTVIALLGTVAAIAQNPPAAPAPAAVTPPAPPPPPTERQLLMRSHQQTQAAFNAIVIGVIDPAELKTLSQRLIDNGSRTIALFAPGTDQADPRAKPEIWKDQAGFKAANDKFIAAVRNAQTKIPDRVAMAEAMVEVGAACGACHTAYRVMPAAAPGGRGRGGRGAAAAAEAAAPAAAAAAPAAAAN
jgi:cytochrome c556